MISVLGGFIAALLTPLSALMVVQFNSLGNRIDNLGTELRAEMASLRAETQAGFREVNAILLDHTDRLARLEAAAGLPHRQPSRPRHPMSADRLQGVRLQWDATSQK